MGFFSNYLYNSLITIFNRCTELGMKYVKILFLFITTLILLGTEIIDKWDVFKPAERNILYYGSVNELNFNNVINTDIGRKY